MPNLYMGRGGIDGLFGGGSGSVGPVGVHPVTQGNPVKLPGPMGNNNTSAPIIRGPFTQTNATNSNPPAPGSVLPAQSIRPTGPSRGYDPAYLQNLATAIGGLFSRPQGNMSFNPLGNLSEISPSSGIGGNAPGFGEPLTWLQQALNGLGFSWQPPKPPTATIPGAGGNGNEPGRNRGGMPINAL